MTRIVLMLVGLAVALLGTPGAWAEPANHLADAQHEVVPGIILAGELHPGALDRLPPGETLIVDLRTAREGTATQATEAERLGIGYVNVPVNGVDFTTAELNAVTEALADAGSRTVVLHCATGNRAGMIWGALQLRHGVPLETVMDDVAPVVTRRSVRRALAAYSRSLTPTGGATSDRN